MQSVLIATTLSVTLLSPLAVALAGAPQDGRPVLVLLSPWTDADTIVRSAGGQIIGPLSAPFATLAYSQEPDFAARLRAAGAVAVRDGQQLAKLCGVA